MKRKYIPPPAEEGEIIKEEPAFVNENKTKTIEISPSNQQAQDIIDVKNASMNKQLSEVFGLNVAERVTIACPHCGDFIALGLEVSRHRVTKNIFNNLT